MLTFEFDHCPSVCNRISYTELVSSSIALVRFFLEKKKDKLIVS